MATASTKRRRKRQQQTRGAAKTNTGAQNTVSQGKETALLSERVWLVASISVLVVAFFLRVYDIELKPFHHDEGVNGFFLTNLLRSNAYTYDPTNYHGPTLYYLALPLAHRFGLKTWAVRLVPVFFGMATVWLALCLRRYVGAIGALTAAALLAVSPGAVFFSRYFIHEMMFAATALGAVVGFLYFYDTGRAQYLLLAAASLALHFATKETHFITLGVIILAALIAWGYAAYMRGRAHPFARRGTADARDGAKVEGLTTGEVVARLGGWGRLQIFLVAAIVVFVLINVLFYSSFFKNWKGVSDAVEALKVWTKTGTGEVKQPIHIHPWHKYIKWLLMEESATLALGALGSALALWVGRNRFAIFAGAWGFGMLAAYSLVPYKTPWLVLNFTVPMAIVAGYGVQILFERARRVSGLERSVIVALLTLVALVVVFSVLKLGPEIKAEDLSALKFLLVAVLAVVGWCVFNLCIRSRGGGIWTNGLPVVVLAALALVLGVYQTWKLNFKEYDNDQYPYVYAHTRRGFLLLLREVNSLAARAGTGTNTQIAVASPGPGSDSYWPLPWYLNDYKGVGYHGSVPFGAAQTPIIIANAVQDAQFRTTLAATHRKVGGIYQLRPGVDLVLYARHDIPPK